MWDGSKREIFVNGVSTKSDQPGRRDLMHGRFCLGARQDGVGPFNGEVADFRYWSCALEPSQFSRDIDRANPPAQLVRWYLFEDDDGIRNFKILNHAGKGPAHISADHAVS